MGYEAEKEALNREGWEENAAVVIGKKEELEVLRERLEKEGRAADLGTYIRMHKQVILSGDDPEMEKLSDKVEGAKGLVFESYLHSRDNSEIRYVDKDGNIVRVDIDLSKIAAYHKLAVAEGWKDFNSERRYQLEKQLEDVVIRDLKKLGFSGERISLSEAEMYKGGGYTEEGKILGELTKDITRKAQEALDAKKERLEREVRERRTKEFDL